MAIDALVARYPELYHMADKRNWDSICKYGLLSTTALLDLFEYDANKRFKIESQLRVKEFPISHPTHGTVVIRDQDPMRDRPEKGIYLDKCLKGISRQEWFEFLNNKTFFWTDKKGLEFMIGARLYRNRSHYVFIVNTRKLIENHPDRVTLSSINSGSLYGMDDRSVDTFEPLSHYSRMPWVRELAVEYSVPDILDLTISVKECKIHWNNEEREKSIKVIRRKYPP